MPPSPPYSNPQDDSGKLSKFEIERRALGPKDVMVDIKFCGICHSDLVGGIERGSHVSIDWGQTHVVISFSLHSTARDQERLGRLQVPNGKPFFVLFHSILYA